MAITLIENQAINFRLATEQDLDCNCNKKPYCQKVNSFDIGKYQIISGSVLANGDFEDGLDGWDILEPINVNLLITNESFDDTCNGEIEVTATGGTSPYEYSIDGINFQSGNTFDNLCLGCYNIVVKDNDGNLGFASGCIGKSVDCSQYNTPELNDLRNTSLSELRNCFLHDLK